MGRQEACSKMKLDLDQHVEFLAGFAPRNIICILIVYLIKLNVESNIVYYCQGTNTQLLWHIWLHEYESLCCKNLLWLRVNLTAYQY